MKYEDLFVLYFDISQDKDKIDPIFYLNIYLNKYLKEFIEEFKKED